MIGSDDEALPLIVGETELAPRRPVRGKPEPREKPGVLAKYARCAHSASERAVTM